MDVMIQAFWAVTWIIALLAGIVLILWWHRSEYVGRPREFTNYGDDMNFDERAQGS